jgi:hypothetical protein
VNWLVGITPPPPFPNHHGPPNRKSINKANDTAWKKGIFSQSDKVRIKNDGSMRFFPLPIMMSWTHVLNYLSPPHSSSSFSTFVVNDVNNQFVIEMKREREKCLTKNSKFFFIRY